MGNFLALELAKWLSGRPEVKSVLHPALPSCVGHEIWKRDFTGSSGLFSIVLKKQYEKDQVAKMLDNMSIFKMGYSWGGFESLIVPYDTKPPRSANPWTDGQLIRIHAGLEAIEDMIEDFSEGFVRLRT